MMLALESIDKCTETFAIRIPEVLKIHLDKLSIHQKRQLNEEILVCMARAVHSARFNATVYLRETKVKSNDAQSDGTTFSIEPEIDG